MHMYFGLNELKREDVALVGGKSSSLGEMTSSTNVPVPYGFATTAHAIGSLWMQTGLRKIKLKQNLIN